MSDQAAESTGSFRIPATQDEPAGNGKSDKPKSFWRELPILIIIALALTFLLQTFIARVYLIPSESMEPTLHGCAGCTGDRIVVEKISYRFGDPKAGDVVVFLGPDSWNGAYVSIRSHNPAIRALQNAGAFIGIVPPDENDLVKRVIATGGQTVECCDEQGRILVDGKPLDEPYVKTDFPFIPGQQDCKTESKSPRCFPAVTVPAGRLWVMGDNRNNSADSRFHSCVIHPELPRCDKDAADYMGDAEATGTVPIGNVRGKAVFVVLPPSRMGVIHSPDIQAN
ncbi:signal peptidase I [Smaragdicoccus niigatensis]|uniref:signal peptidase I n=1 Tax=Smaragdicoccus niigatensis TaxID=359359 RepID=UPI000374E173